VKTFLSALVSLGMDGVWFVWGKARTKVGESAAEGFFRNQRSLTYAELGKSCLIFWSTDKGNEWATWFCMSSLSRSPVVVGVLIGGVLFFSLSFFESRWLAGGIGLRAYCVFVSMDFQARRYNGLTDCSLAYICLQSLYSSW
jgi:hypothetical protein